MLSQTQITKKGLEALQNELGVLLDEKRPKLVERLSFARSQGDLSENNDYQNAKEELEFLDGRIGELQEILKNAKVIRIKNGHNGQVSLGTNVTVEIKGKKIIFNIVGDWEADPKSQKISHTSPLGKALVGKKVGDEVEVEAPAGKVVYKIIEIK